MNEVNLLKLADNLERVELKNFDMTFFRSFWSEEYGIREAAYVDAGNCGTAGCVIGCSFLMKGFEPIASDYTSPITESRYLDYDKYCERLFGIDSIKNKGEWDWCFCGEWARIDNTPKGAAKRIRYMIKEGVPVGWWMPSTRDPSTYSKY